MLSFVTGSYSIICDVYLVDLSVLSSSLSVTEKGILTMSLGSILNEWGSINKSKDGNPAAPLAFILCFRWRQQMLLSSGFIVHSRPEWELI